MSDWDPTDYLRYADERSRPFVDLTARIDADAPQRVVDLGCGPGNLTALLARRWPDAEVEGVDASPAMIRRAGQYAGDRLRFSLGDIRDWQDAEPVDVVVSNATLQWVPGHRAVLPRLVGALRPGGWLAFQVPGNFDQPSHRLLHELADRPPYAEWTRDLERPAAFDPEVYLADLAELGCRVQAWETTYLHVLAGPDPVFHWISSTGARPVLGALPDGLRDDFEAAYKKRLNEAYPPRTYGTVLPYRRIFAVAVKP
ncbi:trans-aconitate 2-methyltransferase [Microlunatus ginsengisoli]|uniref:Trans-aconitate 2-methyltransferase n=1 Tax=Microlunatus ginsengisoli TaxID=363863 RepID=A0ABP7AF38_9ACTN